MKRNSAKRKSKENQRIKDFFIIFDNMCALQRTISRDPSVLIWVQTVCKGYQQTTKVAASMQRVNVSFIFSLGLNEMYTWFLLPTFPSFFNPTLNIKMVFGEKIPKIGTFSDFVTIFFVKYYNKI